MTAPVLELAHLRHDYGQGPVLDLRDVTLPPGAYHVTGANGAGKTTLVAILATLLPPTDARLEVLGLDPLTQGRQLRARLGYAAHDPSLHPQFTVAETLDLHARLHRRPPTASQRSAKAWELTGLLDHPVGQLSHGQARRVDLARATLHEPELLLLDEPTAGLDDRALDLLAPHLTARESASVVSAGPGAPPHPAMRLLQLKDGRLSPATEDATDREAPP